MHDRYPGSLMTQLTFITYICNSMLITVTTNHNNCGIMSLSVADSDSAGITHVLLPPVGQMCPITKAVICFLFQKN